MSDYSGGLYSRLNDGPIICGMFEDMWGDQKVHLQCEWGSFYL